MVKARGKLCAVKARGGLCVLTAGGKPCVLKARGRGPQAMYDLLAEQPGCNEGLQVVTEGPGGLPVKGLTQPEVRSEEAALELFFAGCQSLPSFPRSPRPFLTCSTPSPNPL